MLGNIDQRYYDGVWEGYAVLFLVGYSYLQF